MNKKKCFVIMSFNQRFDHVYRSSIKSAVEDLGLECYRVDDSTIPQNIPYRIIREIINSDLIIADISEQNHEMQIKFFLYAPPTITKELRFIADLFERNYTVHAAFEHAEVEYQNYEKYILHYAKFADKIIQIDDYWRYQI